MYPSIEVQLRDWQAHPVAVAPERERLLRQLGQYLADKIRTGSAARLNFICTHNSRRSHLSQIWAQVWAHWYGMVTVQCYSGGTEATAFHPHAIAALRGQGVRIEAISEGPNPHYAVHFSDDAVPVEAWSKIYTDAANPKEGFAAIMTCDSANEACPVVFGAELRLPLTYEDPKVSDGTDHQQQTYQARSKQIARELGLAFQFAHQPQ